jgi:hypothetical protein
LYDELFARLQIVLINAVDALLAYDAANIQNVSRVLYRKLSLCCIDAVIELKANCGLCSKTITAYRTNGKALPSTRYLRPGDSNRLSPHNTDTCDLRTIVDSCCATERQRQAIALRIDGYTDKEIADLIGYSRETITIDRNYVANALRRELSQSSVSIGA